MKRAYITMSLKIYTFTKEDIITESVGEFATNGIYSEGGLWSGFSSD